MRIFYLEEKLSKLNSSNAVDNLIEENDKLKKEMKDLKGQLENGEALIMEAKGIIDLLQSMKQSNEAELQNYQLKNEEQAEYILRLERDKSSIQKMKEDLNEQLERQKRGFEEDKKGLEMAKRALADENTLLNDKMKGLEKENDALQNSTKELTNGLLVLEKEKDEEKIRFQEEKRGLEDEKMSLEKRLKEQSQIFQSLKTENDEAKEKFEMEKKQFLAEKDTLRLLADELNHKLEDAKSQLQKATSQWEKEKILMVENHTLAIESKDAQLQNSLQESKVAEEKLQSIMEELKHQLDEKEAQMNNLTFELEQTKINLEETKKRFKEELQSVLLEKDELKEQLSKEKKDIQEYILAERKLTSIINDLRMELNEVKADKLRHESDEIKLLKSQLEDRILHESYQIKELKSQLDDKIDQLESKELELSQFKAHYEIEIQKWESICEQQEESINKAEIEKNNLMNLLNDEKNKFVLLNDEKSKMTLLIDEKTKLADETTLLLSEKTKALEDLRMQLTTDFADKNKEMSMKENGLNEKINVLHGVIEKLNGEIEEFKKQISNEKALLSDATGTITILQSMNESHEIELQNYQKKFQEQEDFIRNMEKEKNNLLQSLSEEKASFAVIGELKNQLDDKDAQLKELKSSHSRTLEELQKQLEATKKEADSKKHELDALKQAEHEAEMLLNEYKNQLDDKDVQLKELKSLHSRTLEELQKQLEAKTKEADSKKLELDELKQAEHEAGILLNEYKQKILVLEQKQLQDDSSLQSNINSLNVKVLSLQNDIKELNEAKKGKEVLLSEQTERILQQETQHARELEVLKKTIVEYEQDLQSAKIFLKQKDIELKQKDIELTQNSTKDLDSLRLDFSMKLQEKDRIIQEYNERLMNGEKDHQVTREQKKRLLEEISEFSAKLEKLNEENLMLNERILLSNSENDSKEQLESLRLNEINLKNEISHLKFEMMQVEEEKKKALEYCESHRHLKRKYETLEKQFTELSASYDHLKRKMKKREALISQALGRLKLVNEHQGDLASALEKLSTQPPISM